MQLSHKVREFRRARLAHLKLLGLDAVEQVIRSFARQRMSNRKTGQRDIAPPCRHGAFLISDQLATFPDRSDRSFWMIVDQRNDPHEQLTSRPSRWKPQD